MDCSLLNSPVQCIQGENTELAIKRAVGAALEEELDQFRNVLAKNRHFLE